MSLEKLSKEIGIPKLHYLLLTVIIGVFWTSPVHTYLHTTLVHNWNPMTGKVIPSLLTSTTLAFFFLIQYLRATFFKNTAIICPNCAQPTFLPTTPHKDNDFSASARRSRNTAYKKCSSCGHDSEVPIKAKT